MNIEIEWKALVLVYVSNLSLVLYYDKRYVIFIHISIKHEGFHKDYTLVFRSFSEDVIELLIISVHRYSII